MFKKIVSQLSLSPSAASQLTFYARRLGKERVTRTFSALAAVLVMLLQFATIAAPATSANAASPNDIIYGGVTSKADLLSHWDNSSELRQIYGYWGVTRNDVANTSLITVNSKDHSLKSLGRLQHLDSDTPVNIKVSGEETTFWQRGLYTWDTGSFIKTGSSYQVFAGTTSYGHWFAIMEACGNIVVTTNPTPPPPPPPPKPTPTPTPTPTHTPTPTPTPTPSATPPPGPSIVCSHLTGTTSSGQVPLTVDFTGYGKATGEAIKAYNFSFGDGGKQNGSTATARYTYDTPGVYTASLLLTSSTGSSTKPTSACEFIVTVTPMPAAFLKHKTAWNVTQNVDATTTKANGGDVIRYALVTKNVGGTVADYTVTEQLDYVLQYSNITDPGGGTLTGNTLTYPSTEIDPGKSITKTFEVQVKDPIPATPIGQSDPSSFNLVMDNVYGNTVQIQLQSPLPGVVEAASTQLPDTGSATSSIIVLVVSGLTLYFWLRNRQLSKEVRLLRKDFAGGL